MSKPFERFVVQSVNVNEFFIRVGSSSEIRTALKENTFPAQNKPESVDELMMRRYLFIDEAIKEKLEKP